MDPMQIWTYSLPNGTWSTVEPAKDSAHPPLPISHHSAHVWQDKMVVFGSFLDMGDNGGGAIIWLWHFQTQRWEWFCDSRIREGFPEASWFVREGLIPVARRGHASWMYGSRMFVFGGFTEDSACWPGGQGKPKSSNIRGAYLDDLWSMELDPDAPDYSIWQQRKLRGNYPAPRANAGVAVLNKGSNVLLMGGQTGLFAHVGQGDKGKITHEVFEYDCELDWWREVRPKTKSSLWMTARADLGAFYIPSIKKVVGVMGALSCPPALEDNSYTRPSLVFLELNAGLLTVSMLKGQWMINQEKASSDGYREVFRDSRYRGSTATREAFLAHGEWDSLWEVPWMQPRETSGPIPWRLLEEILSGHTGAVVTESRAEECGLLVSDGVLQELLPELTEACNPNLQAEVKNDIYMGNGFFVASKVIQNADSRGKGAHQLQQHVRVFSTQKQASFNFAATLGMHDLGHSEKIIEEKEVEWAVQEVLDMVDECAINMPAVNMAEGGQQEREILMRFVSGRVFVQYRLSFGGVDEEYAEQTAQILLKQTALRCKSYCEERPRVVCAKCKKCEENKLGQPSNDMQVCRGCGLVRYCSQVCAKEDWPVHRDFCLPVEYKRSKS